MSKPSIGLRSLGCLLLLGACSPAQVGGPDAAGVGGTSGSSGTGESQTGLAAGSGGSIALTAGGAPAATGGAGSAGRTGAGSGGRRASGGGGGGASGGAGAAGSAAGSGGSSQSSAPSGPSLCGGAELLFCESFEGASVDKNVWQTLGSAPSLDSTRAARGGKSLHVHTSAVGSSGLQTGKFLASASGHYYGRLFIWFAALPTSPAWAHWTIVGASAASGASDKSEIRVGGQADGKKVERWGVGTDRGPSGDWTNLDDDPKGAPQPVQLGQWQCVEWLHDWQNDVTRFYLNGTEHPSLGTTLDVKHGANSQVPYAIPELASVWVGFWNYDQGDGGKGVTPREFDVWLDEVAFDDERIGCDR